MILISFLLTEFSLALLFSVSRVHSFVLRPSSTPRYVQVRAMTSTTTIGSATGTTAIGEGASPGLPNTERKSQLSICNNEEGYNLNGVLTVKDEGSKSLWVLCHGLCSSCEGTVPRFVSEELNANTFRFDFAGCGGSGGDWKYAGYDRELGDLRAVVLGLRELGWSVDCVLGHSKGAAAVLRYGETFDDVPLVVNVAGRFDTSETPRSRFTEEQWDQLEKTGSFQWSVKGENLTINRSDFEERAKLNMRNTALAIKRSKVVTIHGTDDETIPVADAREFAKVLSNNELAIIEGATHRFATEPEQREVMKVLSRYVEPVPPTSTGA